LQADPKGEFVKILIENSACFQGQILLKNFLEFQGELKGEFIKNFFEISGSNHTQNFPDHHP